VQDKERKRNARGRGKRGEEGTEKRMGKRSALSP
jgi:hypothetical protein